MQPQSQCWHVNWSHFVQVPRSDIGNTALQPTQIATEVSSAESMAVDTDTVLMVVLLKELPAEDRDYIGHHNYTRKILIYFVCDESFWGTVK